MTPGTNAELEGELKEDPISATRNQRSKFLFLPCALSQTLSRSFSLTLLGSKGLRFAVAKYSDLVIEVVFLLLLSRGALY